LPKTNSKGKKEGEQDLFYLRGRRSFFREGGTRGGGGKKGPCDMGSVGGKESKEKEKKRKKLSPIPKGREKKRNASLTEKGKNRGMARGRPKGGQVNFGGREEKKFPATERGTRDEEKKFLPAQEKKELPGPLGEKWGTGEGKGKPKICSEAPKEKVGHFSLEKRSGGGEKKKGVRVGGKKEGTSPREEDDSQKKGGGGRAKRKSPSLMRREENASPPGKGKPGRRGGGESFSLERKKGGKMFNNHRKEGANEGRVKTLSSDKRGG